MRSFSPLFTPDDLESAFQWSIDLRKDYSPNSDIWCLRRDWEHIKDGMLAQLNDGSYMFGLLDRYTFDDAIVTLWSSQDMIALKLITQALQQSMAGHIPHSCYHIKGHSGLKKAVAQTYEAIANHHYVTRSSALYEPLQGNRNVSRRYKRNPHGRDISEYQVNEPAPTDLYFKNILTRLLAKAALKPDILATLRRYVGQWARWLKLGLKTIEEFEHGVQSLLPSIASCWMPGAQVLTLGNCQ